MEQLGGAVLEPVAALVALYLRSTPTEVLLQFFILFQALMDRVHKVV